MAMMMVGALTYSYIVASMTSIVSAMDGNKRIVQQQLDAIGSFMTTNEFPPPLYRSVIRSGREGGGGRGGRL